MLKRTLDTSYLLTRVDGFGAGSFLATDALTTHPGLEPYPDSVSVVTAEFTTEGGKTRMTATVRYPSLEVRDMVLGTGMATGAGISYDRLEDLVAKLQRA
jgi:uncharacterized protein YndB with AHSA1/START domain